MSLKSKSNEELIKMVDSLPPAHPDRLEPTKELFSRGIYRTPKQLKDAEEFDKLTKKLWKECKPKLTKKELLSSGIYEMPQEIKDKEEFDKLHEKLIKKYLAKKN